MPAPENKILVRDNVMETLLDAVQRHHLVVLSASIGYGKTTAARTLARVAPHRVFYLTVNTGRHNSAYLWDRLCNQMGALGSEMASVFRQVGFPEDSIQMQRLFERGRTHMAGRPTLLIVDDYHYTCSPEVDKLLEMLVREQMPGFCLMILSRTRPELPLDELRLQGLAVVFGQELLAFSRDEANQLFRLHGLGDSADVDRAWELSEGWPASLWLSLQSMLTGGVVTSTRDIESLFASAVISHYSPEDKHLLGLLAFLDTFTPRQVARITGDAGAPRRLMALHERNSFLAYDAATDSYRMHSLFRSFLMRLPEEPAGTDGFGPAMDRSVVFRRTAEWYADEDDVLTALQYFHLAGDEDSQRRILEVFAEKGDGPVVSFDPEGLHAIFAAIPWPVRCREPIGYLTYLFHRMMRVGPEGAAPLLDEARIRFAAEPSIPSALKRRIRGELELFQAVRAFNDLPRMCRHLVEAHKQLVGGACILQRRRLWNFGSPQTSCIYVREAGSYAEILKLLREHIPYYQEITDGCGAGGKDLFEAEYHLEIGNFEEVEPNLMRSTYRAGVKDQVTVRLAAAFTAARLAPVRLAACLPPGRKETVVAEAEIERAVGRLADMRARVFATSNSMLENTLDLALGYLYACVGRRDSIPAWILLEPGGFARVFQQGAAFHLIVQGKALLLAEDLLHLEVFAQDMPGLLSPRRYLFVQIHALVLEAAAKAGRLGPETGALFLDQALEAARPDGLLTLLAEYGRHILPMLDLLHKRRPHDEFLSRVRDLTGRYARLFHRSPVRILSQREKEILGMAAKGMSNPAIAEALGLASITVGKTLSNAYRKLGAKNRVEALRLLPSFLGRE